MQPYFNHLYKPLLLLIEEQEQRQELQDKVWTDLRAIFF